MHREGEDIGIVFEDPRGAVALMHVEIDHQRPGDPALAAQGPDRDRHVIEDAVSLAVIGKGMVGSPGEVDAGPALERVTASLERALHGAEGTLRQERAPRKPETPEFGRGQRPVDHGLDVPGAMHQRQRVSGGPFGLMDRCGR